METRPPRLLGLDIGERRTGVALSDELGLFAHPRPAIHHWSTAELAEAVAALVAAEDVSGVVVGVPLTMGGGASEQTERVRGVSALLRERLGVRVVEWDERLSSTEAGRSVRGRERRKRGDLDSAAAAIVLQAYLDRERAGARG